MFVLVAYTVHKNPQEAYDDLQITHEIILKILWKRLKMIPYKVLLFQSLCKQKTNRYFYTEMPKYYKVKDGSMAIFLRWVDCKLESINFKFSSKKNYHESRYLK